MGGGEGASTGGLDFEGQLNVSVCCRGSTANSTSLCSATASFVSSLASRVGTLAGFGLPTPLAVACPYHSAALLTFSVPSPTNHRSSVLPTRPVPTPCS